MSGSLFRLLVEAVEEYAIFLLDPAGRIASWNRGAERLKGHTAKEAVGRHFSIFHTEEDRQRGHPAEVLGEARERGRFEEEGWRVRKDGSRFWAHVVITAIQDEQGRLLGFGKVTRDLTEAKRAEAERERVLERQRFLAKASTELVRSIDYETTLQRVARLAVPVLADCSVIDLVEEGAFRRVAAVHADPEKEGLVRELRRYPPDPELDGHPVNRAIRTWRSQVVPCGEESLQEAGGSPEHHQLMRQLDAKTVLVVPLTARGRMLGVMQFMSLAGESAREYGPDDVALAEELACRAAFSIDNARLYTEADRRAREERALREAVAAVGARFTTEEAIRQIATSAVAATSADAAFVTRIDAERGEVEVVAVAGGIPVQLPASVPYAGTYTQKVTDAREPLLIPRLAEVEDPLRDGPLGRAYPDHSALVVHLGDEDPIGALFLLRAPERLLFSAREIRSARTFGELVALTFRKLQLLEESEERREELERITDSRTRLMRGFSHDLKNPLGAADGYAQLLEDGTLGELSAEQRASIQGIRRSLKTSLRLIQDLLELARAEAGQIEIECVPTDIAGAARDLAEDFRAQATAAGLALEVHASEPLLATTDPTRVRQVLGNLLSNAVKYTPAGGVTVAARARDGEGFRGGEWIAVSVTDTGPGIPDGKHEHIFEEFTRLDPAAQNGAGVGLAISRRIARLLGGDITVASESGRGSTFTLWVPRSCP